MYVYFEQNSSTRSDCTIHSLSWMGKVPDTLPDDDEWKLNRNQYYQEGWLSSGNTKGIIGVTFTTSHCKKYNPPPRSNFNLRGHRSEVILVRWNEPYQKLATCDAQGIIFVWIKHEGRWSIELINDRNSQVTDFAWSHDGRMALICYRDGFVLVGSVAGQRYWSSMLNLDGTLITCGVWAPDDQKVLFGMNDGQIVVMSSSGVMLAQVTALEGGEITSMVWSCEKFYMDEIDSTTGLNRTNNVYNTGGNVAAIRTQAASFPPSPSTSHMLAVCFKWGTIYLMSSYDDLCPRVINSTLIGIQVDWSNCGEVLAVAGFQRLPNLHCSNEVHFYNKEACLTYKVVVPSQGKPLTALTFGHNDKRLFVAAGVNVHVAWVFKKVPLLQFICQHCIQNHITAEKNANKLNLPAKLRQGVRSLFSPTVKSYIPDPFKLREFVSLPPPGNERLYCTMIHNGDEASGIHYTLYLEYLGGLVPLLKGKRTSKLRPDFVIFDPKIKASGCSTNEESKMTNGHIDNTSDSESDISLDGCGSPRMSRRKMQRQFRPEKVDRSITFRTLDELMFNDNLPENNKLLEVTSNIWGTKFRLAGAAGYLPPDMGQVLYKTSLLHLQPRQMTVTITELTAHGIQASGNSYSRDPHFTPAGMVDDDSDTDLMHQLLLNGTLGQNGSIPFTFDTNLPGAKQTFQTSVEVMHDPADVMLAMCGQLAETGSVRTINSNILVSNACNSTETSPTKGCIVSNGPGVRLSSCPNNKTQKRTSSTKSRTLSPAENNFPIVGQNNAFNCTSIDSTAAHDLLKSATTSSSLTIHSDGGSQPKVIQRCAEYARQTMASIGLSFADGGSGDIATTTCAPVTVRADRGDTINVSITNTAGVNVSGVGVEMGRMMSSPGAGAALGRIMQQDRQDSGPRWADRACQGLKYIDDESLEGSMDIPLEANTVYDCSNVTLAPSTEGSQKRLYLAQADRNQTESLSLSDNHRASLSGYPSDSLESSLLDIRSDTMGSGLMNKSDEVIIGNDAVIFKHGSLDTGINIFSDKPCLGIPDDEITHSTSLPASPIKRITNTQRNRKIKDDLLLSKAKLKLSPRFRRRPRFGIDSSEEDVTSSAEELKPGQSYKNLETFQKARLKQKLRKVRHKNDSENGSVKGDNCLRRRQFVMHNKAPLWNESSQVYQLDFGGRVTQESAKNFQIELCGKQVMQFGRIDGNAYTLDFQHPFSALQAFAVALANVTQRLK